MNQNLHLRPKDQAHYKTRVDNHIFFNQKLFEVYYNDKKTVNLSMEYNISFAIIFNLNLAR